MERITVRGEHGIFVRPELDFGIDEKDYDLVQTILGRLAAYEDTGLEPEDLQLGLNAAGRKKAGAEYYGLTGEELDRAVELFKANDEKRLVVLPCKVGDTVYLVCDWDDGPSTIDVGEVFAISCDKSGTMWVSVRYESGLKFYHPSYDIGKIAFLSREAAEAALTGR